MIQNILRTCIYQGHEEYQVTHLCTFGDCKQTSRWCCSECLAKGIHNHKKQDNNHLMNKKEIHQNIIKQYDIIKQDLDSFKSNDTNLFKQILKVCEQMEKSIIVYRNQYQIIEKYIQKIISSFEQCLSHIKDNNFQQLDGEKINQILNLNQYKFDQEISKLKLFKSLDEIKQQFHSIEMIIKEYQDNQKKKYYIYKTIALNDRQYIIQEIDSAAQSQGSSYQESYYFGSSISKNEQFVAYGAFRDKLLKIYNLKQKKIIKEIKLDDYLYFCQFTNDSSQIYIGLWGGYVYGYDVQDNFNEIYKQKIHSKEIKNIITIQNEYLITFSGDYYIIKTDIKSKQQIFKLTGHTSQAIDYNDKDEIIVSGQADKSIKLWNCRNQCIIINKEKSHNSLITQVQLINDNLNILSLDYDSNLYKWKIDLTNKDLIKLQQFGDQNRIFNFYQVNQDQNLLIICNNYAKILNQQGETINTIEHGDKDGIPWPCRQLDNLKFILIRIGKKIILAIAQA